jgi:hypothetical protein
MSRDDQFVASFTSHLTRWFILRQAVAAVTVWAFLWGTAILILKATQGTSLPTLLWGAAGLPVAVALAVWIALRKLPDRSVVRALLDAKGECGGLLMAGAECDLGKWKAEPKTDELPRLQWRGQRALAFLAVAVAYVALGFLLPARSLAVNETPFDITRPADRLTEQVKVLQEEKILEAKRAEEMKQKLDDLRSQSTGKDPAKTLEALDHLNDVVKQEARKAAEQKARQADQLGKVQTAAEALQKAAPNLDSKELAELMKELNALAQQTASENEGFEQELSKELADALKDGKLAPEQLKKLAEAAKNSKESISKSAQKLKDAKLIDSDQLKQCEGGQCDGKGLADYLAKKGSEKKSLKEGLKRQEGKGGVDDDGPGETPLNFSDRTTEDGAKFKEEALPPSELAALKESQRTGVSKAPPKPDANAGTPQSGVLNGATIGGGSANSAPVLPQHRGPVGRYFDRPMK